MLRVTPGATFEAFSEFASGLVGTLGVRIRTSAGADFLARTTAGIAADVTVGSSTVYRRSFTAPTTRGQYELVWDDGTEIFTEPLEVTQNLLDPAAPSANDLCTLADVQAIVPGYRGNDSTDTTLQRFITSESALIPAEAGREIVNGDGLIARTFPVDERCYLFGRVDIGDLSAFASGVIVEVLNTAGTSILAVDADQIVPLYGIPPSREYARDTWEPVTALRFRPGTTLGYRTTLKVTGIWGFPGIPPFIREACAKRVILRYVSDVAGTGTQLADSIDNLNLAAMFASARDAIDILRGGPVMIR